MKQLEVKNLTFEYAIGRRQVLHGISFDLEAGDFLTVCGSTGSGKTTLLRCLKRELMPAGVLGGDITINGVSICHETAPEGVSVSPDAAPEGVSVSPNAVPEGESTRPGAVPVGESICPDASPETASLQAGRAHPSVGFVMQNPEHQIVTDKVWHELAFGLENLGIAQDLIRRKVAEMAAYFGIESWFERSTDELSGGQKQLLSLAAVCLMDPEILILDEPTAQLDPVAAADFLGIVERLNREMGITVIVAEHRLEQVLPMSTKLLVLEDGRNLGFGNLREVIGNLSASPDFLLSMPAPVRLYHEFPLGAECPLTVPECSAWLKDHFCFDASAAGHDSNSADSNSGSCTNSTHCPQHDAPPVLEISDLWFRYERNGPDILRGTAFSVYEGEIHSILGGNGSGKTTALGCIAGILKPYAGHIRVFGKKLAEYRHGSLYRSRLSMLPQDVQTLFQHSTVRKELADCAHVLPDIPVDLTPLMDMHPYDLSGGQQQLVALAKVLASQPRLLLLDEPTKGLDPLSRRRIAEMLRALRERGITIIIVTHDVEFAAGISDRCSLFFRGEVVSQAPVREFFSDNKFYTTQISRMTRGILANCVTYDDALGALRRCRRQSK